MTVEQALETMLAGSALVGVKDAKTGSFTVRRVAAAPAEKKSRRALTPRWQRAPKPTASSNSLRLKSARTRMSATRR
ncbi:MAG: hypothetical protein NTV51_07835 [Verrucomicrobia bacterium]|nr:hypothetical protein [Verrucomicrobiota bacterium]